MRSVSQAGWKQSGKARGPLIGDLCSKGTRLRLEFLKGDITAVIWMSLGFRSACRNCLWMRQWAGSANCDNHTSCSAVCQIINFIICVFWSTHTHARPGLAFLLVGHLRQTKRLHKSKQMSIINVTFKMSVEIMHFVTVMQEICNFWKAELIFH